MSYNIYNPYLNLVPLVPFHSTANSTTNEEGSQTTASTITSPVEPRGWPARNSQEGEGLPQTWNRSWNPLQNPLQIPLPSNTTPNTNTFGPEGYGRIPNLAGLGINSGLGLDGSSHLGDAAWRDWVGDISDGGNSFDTQLDMPSNGWVDDFGLDTSVRFDTPTSLGHPTNNKNLSGESGVSADLQFSHDVASSAFDTSAQLASGVQDAGAPQHGSTQTQQGVRHTTAQGSPPSPDDFPPHPSSRSRSRVPNLGNSPFDASEPQDRQQSSPTNQRRGLSTPRNPRQPSTPQGSNPLFPSRLSPETAAFADISPANQFLESVSSLHLLDRMACVDVLMHSELFKDYVKPHLWNKLDEGLARGARLAARTRLGMNDTVEEVQRKHEGLAMRRKAKFQDKQIQNELRLRQRAGMVTGDMMAGASETGEMTLGGSKRRRQASNPGYGSTYEPGYDPFDSDSDLLAPSQHSPKKSRNLQSTPSELVNKFCSVTNIGRQNPFFDDAIHRQLRNLNTVQLIDAAPEYFAQHGEISDTKVEHWRACAGQASGLVMGQEHACKHCTDHMGDGSVPFSSCVVIDNAEPAGRELQGACMNCVYLGKDQQCSLRSVRGEGAWNQ
ncbi:hypothetical protein DSL72_001485 [Monilinia vaccinii-corymbosi]|uniref:Uncharacterized protein n=1 Tax=Monilinia vaccinii-corymbosi TaxID=61207 RepID=A0A8A3P7G6_9HELO|nr:hypothetical protein DSL72_001485 [Monilinia vaccinii-corymbosi]